MLLAPNAFDLIANSITVALSRDETIRASPKSPNRSEFEAIANPNAFVPAPKRSPQTLNITVALSPLDFAQPGVHRPLSLMAFSIGSLEHISDTNGFPIDASLYGSKRIEFLPFGLELSPPTEPEAAIALMPRSFAPTLPPATPPVFTIQPKPSQSRSKPPPFPAQATSAPLSPSPPAIPPTDLARGNTAVVLTDADKAAARTAWQYFARNWHPETGLVNAVEDYPWTTLWDQGSAILGILAARQLNLITPKDFDSRLVRLFLTLKTLPLAATGLPNKAYSTRTAQMRTLDNRPDPKGTSGWSVLDTARFLMALQILKTHYPNYRPHIDQIVQRWKLAQLVNAGWLQGGVFEQGHLVRVQEGRLGYEQYAAQSLKLWNILAPKALSTPPVVTVQLAGISLAVDRRNRQNSGASNPLTNDPYLLWGLELGWPNEIKPQAMNLLAVQRKRYEKTGLLTAVNEDSLDRPPYFIYGSVYADGKTWVTQSASGQPAEGLKHLSLKAAFAWDALMPDNAYAQMLRKAVQGLSDQNRGFFTGRYENPKLGVNTVCNVNTNAIVLESIFYKARKNKPLNIP